MKILQVVCGIVLFAYYCNAKILKRKIGIPPAGAPQSRAVSPDWGTIEQKLNHFDATDDRTWTMRYMNNSQFYKEGGPMFVFLGGEWEIEQSYLVTGQMFDMADEHDGYMYYTEHRYYGRSLPTSDFASDALKYLSADQALADIAYFITEKKKEIPGIENSKVVVVGGSYSGNLAAWARIKYPHLITAALSSSAPLHAIEDFYQYFEVVNTNIGLVSNECLDTISTGIAQMVSALENEESKKNLEESINTCVPINTEEPYRSYFFNSIANIFAGMVQYAQNNIIQIECDNLLGKDGNSMEKLVEYVKDQYYGFCMGDYDEFIEIYQETELTTDIYRQWYYQTCTEYGYYQTSNSTNQPFGDTFFVGLSHATCKDLFGDRFTPEVLRTGIERTNIVYGSINPDMTQVVSVHGTVDPWHSIGLLHDLSPLAPTFVVNGTSHCEDLGSISSTDLPEMREVKQKVKELIAEWIK